MSWYVISFFALSEAMGGTSALLDPTFDLLELDLIRLEAKVGLGKVYARGSVFTLLILRSFDKA